MKVLVCNGRSCSSSGSQYIIKRIRGDIERESLQDSCEIEYSLCQGNCQFSPCMKIATTSADGVLIEEQLTKLNPIIASKKVIEYSKKLGK